jgi:hypothetical protein
MQRGWKFAEIVNGFGKRHCGHLCVTGFPVAENAEYCPEIGKFLANFNPNPLASLSSMAFIGQPWPINRTGIP